MTYHLEMVTSECANTSAPFSLSILSGTISSCLLLITLPTNLLVCLAITLDPFKQLRTQFNCFTFNLALADLLVGFITEPISVYSHLTEAMDTDHKRQTNEMVVKLFHIPYFISTMASILSVAALAFERYFAIVLPFRYRQSFNIQLSIIISILIWLIALTFGLININRNYIIECFIFVNTGVLLTSIIVMFACFHIRTSLQKVSRDLTRVGVINNTQSKTTDQRLMKTFVLMIGALIICYLPACFVIYYMNLCQHCDCGLIQWFRDLAFWLILLNSALNPYIYAIRSKKFRSAIKYIITCKYFKLKKQVNVPLVAQYRKNEHGNKTDHQNYGSVSNESSNDKILIH